VNPGESSPDPAVLARSMLLVHGAHDDDHRHVGDDNELSAWSKAPDFADDPARAAAVH
jgi:hypothetical protein